MDGSTCKQVEILEKRKEESSQECPLMCDKKGQSSHMDIPPDDPTWQWKSPTFLRLFLLTDVHLSLKSIHLQTPDSTWKAEEFHLVEMFLSKFFCRFFIHHSSLLISSICRLQMALKCGMIYHANPRSQCPNKRSVFPKNWGPPFPIECLLNLLGWWFFGSLGGNPGHTPNAPLATLNFFYPDCTPK